MPVRLLAHRRRPVSLSTPFEGASVVVFDPRIERSHEALANRLRAQDLALGTVDLLVIRAGPTPRALELVIGDRTLRRFLDGVPVLVLAGSADAAAREPVLTQPSWSPPPPFRVRA